MNKQTDVTMSMAVLWMVLGGGALCVGPLCVGPPQAFAAPIRPNIILVMADDLGWGDVSSFDSTSPIFTPHLDAMCQRGLKLTRFYAGSPVCSPTRGSCLTGRHAARYDIPTANAGHLREGEYTLAHALQQLGYRTGHFGKWHLGTLTRDYSGKGPSRHPEVNFCTPGMRGFDEWFSTEFAVATWDPYDPANSHVSRRLQPDPRALYWHNGVNVKQSLEGCDSQIIMDRALAFLRQAVADAQPVFAVIWFHAPHQPVIGGPDFLARYASFPQDQRHYFAVVTAMDQQVGRLRRRVEGNGSSREHVDLVLLGQRSRREPGPRRKKPRFCGTVSGTQAFVIRGRSSRPGRHRMARRSDRGRRIERAVRHQRLPTDDFGFAGGHRRSP